jgi:VanZ family protein
MKRFKALSIKRKVSFVIFSTLSVSIILFIFYNSTKTADASSADSNSLSVYVSRWINFLLKTSLTPEQIADPLRTFAHFSEFAALAFCVSGAYRSFTDKTKSFFIKIFVFTTVSALTDETIQIFSEGRAFQVFDLFIDTIGGISGFAVFLLLTGIFYKFKNAKNG